MTPDQINGLFELLGAFLVLKSVQRVIQDGGYAGIYLPAVIFFSSWGVWNLFYYPHLEQWWSLAGGLLLVGADIAWVGVMVWYGKVKVAPREVFNGTLASDLRSR